MSFSTQDTIVAIATPPGRGGIGVVRLSGPGALPVSQSLITHAGPLQPRHATFTTIVDAIDRERVRAGERGLFEADPVVDQVACGFCGVPFEAHHIY